MTRIDHAEPLGEVMQRLSTCVVSLVVAGCTGTGDSPSLWDGTTSGDPPADGGAAAGTTGGAADASDGPATAGDASGGVKFDVGQASGGENTGPSDDGTCDAGQFRCQGPRVMSCDTSVMPPRWVEVTTCDPDAGEVCDTATGDCVPLQPIGGTTPTGTYFQFADFHLGESEFRGGYDVDGHADRLYVTSEDGDNTIDVYRVDILDSDGDGLIEPNQHPDSPTDPGPIETRTLVFVESIPDVDASGSTSEIYALADRLFVAGDGITEYVFGAGANAVAPAPEFESYSIALLGYEDVAGVWYGAYDGDREVYQYDAETGRWGYAFAFPALAGDHFDGMEVVTDPATGTSYVYVSDMTSDFIGQYRLDPDQGWVQENLFSYVGTDGSDVEGMGFGAFGHFWATDGWSLYEIGGGTLSDYTEPEG